MKFPLCKVDEEKCLELVKAVTKVLPYEPRIGYVWQLYKLVGPRDCLELLPVYVLNTNNGFKFFESEERAEQMKLFFM